MLLAYFVLKSHDFAIRKCDAFTDVNAYRYDVICIFNPLAEYRFNSWLYYTLHMISSFRIFVSFARLVSWIGVEI